MSYDLLKSEIKLKSIESLLSSVACPNHSIFFLIKFVSGYFCHFNPFFKIQSHNFKRKYFSNDKFLWKTDFTTIF